MSIRQPHACLLRTQGTLPFLLVVLAILAPRASDAALDIESADGCERVQGQWLTNIPMERFRARWAAFSGDKRIVLKSVGFGNVTRITLDGPRAFDPTVLPREPGEYIEPNYVVRANSGPSVPLGSGEVQDPQIDQQWAIDNPGGWISIQQAQQGADIHAKQAWQLSKGSASVAIAVLDTGVNYRHPDLDPNIWRAEKAFPVTGTGQSCPQGARGFNAITAVCGTDVIDDDNGHGSLVAGIMGAVGGNGHGIAGVSWRVTLIPVKVLDENKAGSVDWIIAGMAFVQQLASEGTTGIARSRIRVVSNSWGYGPNGSAHDKCESQALSSAVQGLADARLLIVTAAGNDVRNIDAAGALPYYMASFSNPNIISVTATDSADERLATFGAISVDLAAPGYFIRTTARSRNGIFDRFTYDDGTSMSAAFVSGAAALLFTRCPSLDALGAKQMLMDTVDRNPGPGHAGATVTEGRLNAGRALNMCVLTHRARGPRA